MKKGDKVLDVGCGIGGPLREIAAFTGADVTGLNNNAFQISRGEQINKSTGRHDNCGFIKADFMNIPVPDNTFDAVYQIEATCHAPDAEKCYAEIFRVLKPGGVFASYEWCLTEEYDPKNEKHKQIRQDILLGNGLPTARSCKDVSKAMKAAGFKLEEEEDLVKTSDVNWYEPIDPNKMYAISLDPSTGTGGDNAAIVCYDLPTMNQVCEWQHNKTPIEGQIKLLRDIAKEINSYGATEIYWTVENNAIGEAALVVIRDTGEESFPGTFLHEPNKVQGKKGRKGYHTHHKNKMEGALAMKRLIESDKLTLCSKNIVREIKEFVARGTTFAAKPGGSDDLVMATLVCVRMINYIAQYEDAIYDEIETSVNDDDDFNGPLPIGVL